MARFAYNVAEDGGYDACLVCNRLDDDSDVRMKDVLALDWNLKIEHGRYEGMEIKFIPRILPEFEFLQYATNHREWRSALADGDVFFAVGGANHCSLPLLLAGAPYGSWTATPFWEDRKDRLAVAGSLRKLRDKGSRPIMEYLEQRSYSAADPVFVLSEYTADSIATRYDIARTDIKVVPYPIDTETFTPNGDLEADVAESPSVLFVGRFNDDRKHVELLVDAFAEVREAVTDAQLFLIGDTPDETVVQRFRMRGIEEDVTCIDYLENPELARYYRSADVFAIPSRQEGLGIVGLEAMASGLPVVSTRCGGPEDYVVEGETGHLVPVDDQRALAARIRDLLEDEDRREEFGQAAREVIVEEYAAADAVETFYQAFDRLERESSSSDANKR